MAHSETLMPLRIPTGWAVRWNGFYEHDREGYLESEDILWMERIGADGESTGPFIDLGWYGSREEGRFRVVHMHEDWDHEVKRFESRDRNAIAHEIELWLPTIS